VLRTGLTHGRAADPAADLVGDLHGLNTLEHQPAKVAAMEGIWQTEPARRCCCSPCPTSHAQQPLEIGIPKLASLILTHDLDGEIRGLNDFPGDAPAGGAGVLRLPGDGGHRHADAGVVAWVGLGLLWRRRWAADALPRWLLWPLAGMTFSGWVATLAGWYVTEIGRQPFIVHGLLRTADVASRRAGAAHRADAGAVLHPVPGPCWWPMWRWCATGREARGQPAARRPARRLPSRAFA
jgi:cytochrome d ubiquinol oxidase subunit I